MASGIKAWVRAPSCMPPADAPGAGAGEGAPASTDAKDRADTGAEVPVR